MARRFIPAIVLSILMTLAAFNGALAAGPRTYDAVVVPGALLEDMEGREIGNMGVFAWQGGSFIPIPFQIDEKTEASISSRKTALVYVGSYPSETGPDSDPLFDRDDEVCFMARDAAARAPDAAMPPGAALCSEIDITDPETGRQAFAYLCAFSAAATKSGVSYVHYDPALDAVNSAAYTAGFDPEMPATMDALSIPPENGGSGVDLLDSFRVRFDMLIIGGFYGHVLDNRDFPGKLLAVKAGPVRVIRVLEATGEVWPFYLHHPVFYTVHYPEAMVYDMEIKAPLARGRLELTMDLDEQASNMTFYSQNNLAGVMIDGEMSDAEKELDYSPSSWTAISGSQGSVLMRLVLPRGSRAYPDLYYRDDRDMPDRPGSNAGLIGRFGFSLSPLQDVEPEPARLRTWLFFPPGTFTPGEEAPFLAVNDRPLRVEINGNIGQGQVSAAALPEDTRPPEQGPKPSFETRSMTEERTAGILPWVLIDPNLGNGAGASYVDRDLFDRGIDFTLGGLISTRLYKIFELDTRHLPVPPGIDEFALSVYYQDHPNRYFYGIGPLSDSDDLVVYRRQETIADFTFEKYWGEHFGSISTFQYRQVEVSEGEMVTGELDSIEEHFGEDDELLDGERWGPRAYGMGAAVVNSIKLGAFYDLRDNDRYPTRGMYLKGDVQYVGPALGADYEYLRPTVQASFYFSPHWLNLESGPTRHIGPANIGGKFYGPGKKRVIAVRATVTDLMADEIEFDGQKILDVPFYELCELGDANMARGYYEARQRGNDLVALQAELRWLAYKDKLHLFLFVDGGRVFDDVWDPTNPIDDEDSWLVSYGAGVIIHTLPDYFQRITIGFSDEVTAITYVGGWYSFEDWPRQRDAEGKDW